MVTKCLLFFPLFRDWQSRRCCHQPTCRRSRGFGRGSQTSSSTRSKSKRIQKTLSCFSVIAFVDLGNDLLCSPVTNCFVLNDTNQTDSQQSIILPILCSTLRILITFIYSCRRHDADCPGIRRPKGPTKPLKPSNRYIKSGWTRLELLTRY